MLARQIKWREKPLRASEKPIYTDVCPVRGFLIMYLVVEVYVIKYGSR